MPPLSIVMLVAGTRGDVQVRPLSLLCGTQTPMHVAFRWAWGAGGVAVRLPSLLRSKNAARAPAWTMWKELPRAEHVGGLLPTVWQRCGLAARSRLGLSFGIESWPLVTLQPFISLGLELQKYGHRVRLATHAVFR